jgi:DNA transformation protein
MRAESDFAAYCAELFALDGRVRSKRMFGAYGIYVDDLFIAIVSAHALYLKVDEQTRAHFEAAGGHCFQYTRQGHLQPTGFWTVPPDAMDSPAAMRPWSRLALDAARRAQIGRRPHAEGQWRAASRKET